MTGVIDRLDEAQVKALLLRVLAWRLGDLPDLPKKLTEAYSIETSEALAVLELFCHPLDFTIRWNPASAAGIADSLKIEASDDCKGKLARATFEIKDKCIAFCLEHAPSLSRVLYHDWHLQTQVATESLGRIGRPVASITLRVQPAAKGAALLPPLESVSMELAKDMVDALSAGFDRLQTQLGRIVQ